MAQVTYFIYCGNVDRKKIPEVGESIILENPFSVLTPEFIPGLFSFSIAFSILGVDATRPDNLLQIIISDEEGNIIADTNTVRINELPPDESNTPTEYKGINFTMDFRNVPFQHNGLYTTKVIFNTSLIYENSIYVSGKKTVNYNE